MDHDLRITSNMSRDHVAHDSRVLCGSTGSPASFHYFSCLYHPSPRSTTDEASSLAVVSRPFTMPTELKKKSVKQRHQAPAAERKRRGILSARAWEDIRQAARLARSEGVKLFLHGVDVSQPAGSRAWCTTGYPRATALGRGEDRHDRARRQRARADGTRRPRTHAVEDDDCGVKHAVNHPPSAREGSGKTHGGKSSRKSKRARKPARS